MLSLDTIIILLVYKLLIRPTNPYLSNELPQIIYDITLQPGLSVNEEGHGPKRHSL